MTDKQYWRIIGAILKTWVAVFAIITILAQLWIHFGV